MVFGVVVDALRRPLPKNAGKTGKDFVTTLKPEKVRLIQKEIGDVC